MSSKITQENRKVKAYKTGFFQYLQYLESNYNFMKSEPFILYSIVSSKINNHLKNESEIQKLALKAPETSHRILNNFCVLK